MPLDQQFFSFRVNRPLRLAVKLVRALTKLAVCNGYTTPHFFSDRLEDAHCLTMHMVGGDAPGIGASNVKVCASMDIAAPALLPDPAAFADSTKAKCAVVADAPAFTIGQLADCFGVTLRTLRFYESVGLLSPRRNGAARFYAQSDHDRIELIVQGKKLGFTLREIRELLASPHGDADHGSLQLSREQCVEQINLLERQKRTIDNALVELRRTYSSHYVRDLSARGD